MSAHPIQRRYQAEELVRLRRADEEMRTAASQRQGRIDPNPHQIDAVIFALRRIRDGGCILADEVGLGKTIEAGLILAQLIAEGAQRILVIVPKPLLGQWQEELRSLFGIEAREATLDPAALAAPGVQIVGRELAGSVKGSAAVSGTAPFDLCVIDEAHEIFAAIHKRYDKAGEFRDDAPEALTAHRVRQFLGTTPVLLLTATPIQNSLAELWGLVQYVEPTGTLLGDLRTFRDLFCDGDDRRLAPGQEHELRRRLATICQRTLRRQAQEFLEHPFVDRRCLLFEYSMTAEERSLYENVTEYLVQPSLCAFAGRSRQLLLIAFHRLMGSSVRALARALEGVAARLRGFLEGKASPARKVAADLEDDELDDDADDAPPPADPATIRDELALVERFIARARSLPQDSKAAQLVKALGLAEERRRTGQGSGKAVIFTESLATQEYIRDLLVAAGWADTDITLFRGQNDSSRAEEALRRWSAEVGDKIPRYRRPSRDVAVRMALVHEFRTRSRVFVSTEAGAKGLNLQFCDMVVNYDLPWNPQRIEQRIGRCHRYGQEREVTVVNFLARDNEAHRLLYEILSQKLELFGRILDASDNVLHEPRSAEPSPVGSALSVELETELRRIYERSRSRDEIVAELKRLREEVARRRDEHEQRLDETAGLIQSRFDAEVRQVFRRHKEELPRALARFDRGIDQVLTSYLEAIGASFRRLESRDRISYDVSPSPALPEALRQGGLFLVGDAKKPDGHDPVNLQHPLILAALDEARRPSSSRTVVIKLPPDAPAALQGRRGARGRLVVLKLGQDGFERVERLVPVALFEGHPAMLPPEQTRLLLSCPIEDRGELVPPLALSEVDVDDVVEEALFLDQAEAEPGENRHFERASEQLEQYADDRARVLRRRLEDAERRIAAAQARRDAARTLDARDAAVAAIREAEQDGEEVADKIGRLEAREDDRYRALRDSIQRRRAAPARTERIIDVEIVLA